MLACIVGMVVELQQDKLPTTADANGQHVAVATSTMVLMYALFIASVFPQGISNCYKQKVLKGGDLDVMWVSLWAGNFQVVWGMLGYTTTWIHYPVPGGYNNASPATLVSDLRDAWICFTGANPSSDVTSCSTDAAWTWFMLFLLFNVSFNLILLWLMKYLSATWASVSSVLCGNLYGVFGQSALLAGKGAAPMPVEQWLALILSSMAMWVYNIEDEQNVDGTSAYVLSNRDSDKAATEMSRRRKKRSATAPCMV
jgi:hypothetical protein